MNIFGFLNQERTISGACLGSKKKALETLSSLLSCDIENHNQEQIFDSLIARERLGSTGLGSGIALPHCRLARLQQSSAAMLTLAKPIDFDSPDQKDVDIIFCLVVPEKANEEHLQILSYLARLFSDPGLCRQVREAEYPRDILDAIHQWQQNAAA